MLFYYIVLLTLVMLRKEVPDKVQEIKIRIAKELKEIITYGREEEQAGVNLESVMQDENDYFDLVLDDNPVAKRQEDINDCPALFTLI